MDTVKLQHAGATIELPAQTVVANWLQSIQQQPVLPTDIPAIGSYWKGQGGIYAGVMRGETDMLDRYLIVPTDPAAEFEPVEWGAYGKELESCDWKLYGMRNTAAMESAGIDLAKKIRALNIEGHSDFYLPARHELRLCFINVPELFQKEWYWSSTQSSASLAFSQGFTTGYQSLSGKDLKLRARAVRSIQVSN